MRAQNEDRLLYLQSKESQVRGREAELQAMYFHWAKVRWISTRSHSFESERKAKPVDPSLDDYESPG